MKKMILLSLALLSAVTMEAKITLPPLLDDDMVLQRNTRVKFWGKSAPSRTVTVLPSWSGISYRTESDTEGNWMLEVATDAVGGPYTVKLSDGEELVLRNILLGDVWLCSGQSNMEMPLKGFVSQPVDDAQEIVIESEKYPEIRMFTLKKAYSVEPEESFEGKWEMPSIENTPDFSATAYLFARSLYDVLGIPVGVVHTSWGGSMIEAWMSREAIGKYPHFQAGKVKSDSRSPHHAPAMLYNAMIYPLRDLSLKGFIWYQAESNRTNYEQYTGMFTDMVSGWRALFPGAGEAPFYFVQIAPFNYGDSDSPQTAYLREAQARCLSVPHTGMAVTLDEGDEFCIHPRNKVVVGQRLAYQALAKTYHKKIVCDGPVLRETAVEKGRMVLTFDHADGGLNPLHDEIPGFELAGRDGKFYPATAKVRYGSRVEVWSDQVKEPEYVRYGFKNYVKGGLYNGYHLPAASFRTDDFKPEHK